MIPTERFSNKVSDYVAGRPGYPDAAVAWLVDTFGLVRGASVADVGAGTGISSELFLRHGFSVTAVEPNRAMREAAIARLGRDPRFRAVDASAEATSLPGSSIDAVVAAQAFHWLDPAGFRAECERILKPRGVIVILWNVRRVEGSSFAAGYEKLLRDFGTDYLTVRHENVTDAQLAAFFGRAFESRVFDNVQVLDRDALRARLLSSSYIPAAGHPSYEPMLIALEVLFEKHQRDGRVDMEYDLRVYASRLDA